MSKRRRGMTAAELMAKLQGDPKFQEREAEKERARKQRDKAYDQMFRPYLTQLQNLGLQGNSIEEIVKAYCPLRDDAVSVLLVSLESLSEPRVVESVVRALGAAAHPFDGRPLARCFESTDDVAVKWAVANTIALAHPHSIDDWVTELCKSPYWDKTLRDLGLNR